MVEATNGRSWGNDRLERLDMVSICLIYLNPSLSLPKISSPRYAFGIGDVPLFEIFVPQHQLDKDLFG